MIVVVTLVWRRRWKSGGIGGSQAMRCCDDELTMMAIGTRDSATTEGLGIDTYIRRGERVTYYCLLSISQS